MIDGVRVPVVAKMEFVFMCLLSNSVQCPLRQLRGTEKQGRNTTPHWPRQRFFVKKTSIFVTRQPRPSFVRTKITSAWSFFIVIHVSVFLCVCVCVSVTLSVCRWMTLSVSVLVCLSVFVCEWLSLFMYVCVFVYVSVWVWVTLSKVQTYRNNIEQKELYQTQPTLEQETII